MLYTSLESYLTEFLLFCCTKIFTETEDKSQVKNLSFLYSQLLLYKQSFFLHFAFLKYESILLINHTKWFIIKVKYPPLDMWKKLTCEEEENNTRAMYQYSRAIQIG